MDNPSLEDFLRRAIVWPDPDDPLGWVNLHWRIVDRKGITGGEAFKTIESLLGFIGWTQTKGKGKIADLYYCTSLQAQHGGPKPNGRYSALRSVDNALASKLLFADVDKYESKAAALAAIKSFAERSNSPYPTALVDSGGGIHAYWILPKPFPKEEWLELAHRHVGLMTQYGLKHDSISTDMARILRPPETKNYKRNKNGDPVVCMLLNGDVDLDAWKSLHQATPAPTLARASAHSVRPIEDLFVTPEAVKTGPAPGFRGLVPIEEQIGEGIIDATPVFELCPMFREAIDSGGKDVGQPVWHQQALACTFLFDGRQHFHDLGRQHSDYSRDGSDAMYDRKIRDRFLKGLGYPSCAAFERDGAPQCKTCPLRGKVTSPLNINAKLQRDLAAEEPDEDSPELTDEQLAEAVVHENGVEISRSVTNGVGTPQNDKKFTERELFRTPSPDGRPWIPPEFDYEDDTSTIVTYLDKKANRRLFDSPFLGHEVVRDEKGNALGVNVQFMTWQGKTTINIQGTMFNDPHGAKIYECLNEGGCLVRSNQSRVHEFMSSFRGRMRLEDEARRMVPMGWAFPDKQANKKHGEPFAFAFDRKAYYNDGRVLPSFSGDPQLNEIYSVSGVADSWVTAMLLMFKMNSVELQVMVLAAFAAPLMLFSNHPCTVIMAKGHSGGSKSTTSAIAAAVWANPRLAVLKPSSSKLGTMKRSAGVKHLPVIWDDVRKETFPIIKDTLMEITQGGEGLKLNQDRSERAQGIWDNMLLTSSNDSLAEYLESVSKDHGASLARCFEFEVAAVERNGRSYIDPLLVDETKAELDYNYGHAGCEYAQLLASKSKELRARYKEIAKRIEKKIEHRPHERYWLIAVASMLLAADLANELALMKDNGLRFDPVPLEEFLLDVYLQNRQRFDATNVHLETHKWIEHWLREYFNTHVGPRHEVVFTEDAPVAAGRTVPSTLLFPIMDGYRRQTRVTVRWITGTRTLRIARNALEEFLKEKEVSVDRMRKGLPKYYKAELNPKCRMAAGLNHISGQAREPVYEIKVRPGSWLDAIMQTHVKTDAVPRTGQSRPSQSPDQEELRPRPEQTGPEDGSTAS